MMVTGKIKTTTIQIKGNKIYTDPGFTNRKSSHIIKATTLNSFRVNQMRDTNLLSKTLFKKV